MWYGVSSIAARFLNYLITPYLTDVYSVADYGRMGAIYAFISILNVIFTYGMETSYFRFSQRNDRLDAVNYTATFSLLFSTVLLAIVLWLNQGLIADIVTLRDFPLLIQLSIVIIALDALTTIPFARLRQEGRPKKFAFVRVTGIFLNLGFTIFFLSFCPRYLHAHPGSWVHAIYDPKINPVSYVLIANIIQSAFNVLMLLPRILPGKGKFDWAFWKEMMIYSLPMMVAGLGGMINETFDRIMLGWWSHGPQQFKDDQRGVYNACYKLSLLISLFIQAFRMGAEPFFFKQAGGQNAKFVYARVMKFFVITICVMFLFVSLFLPVWKYFIAPKHWNGLAVVPVLLIANMFLGIYINLSVWYKVTNRTIAGMWITLIGSLITLVINYFFIPTYGYMACAWATFSCYGSMMVISYIWGQKEYAIPYATKKLTAYMVISIGLFFVHKLVTSLFHGFTPSVLAGLVLLGAYSLFIFRIERKEFRKLPVVGRYL